MLPSRKFKQHGKLHVTIYTFKNAGDELPVHTHPETLTHVTIVARGRFKAFGWKDGESIELKAGEMIAFNHDQHHGLMALEPNSRVFNIPYALPDDYAGAGTE